MALWVGELQVKTFPISEVEKVGLHFFFPFYHHFQIQSECLGGLFLNLFDALNPTALMIFLYLPWSLRCQPKRLLLKGR